MHRQHQHVALLAEPQESGSQQRPHGDVEGDGSFPLCDRGDIRFRHPLERQIERLGHPEHRLRNALHAAERRAQHLVPRHHRVEAPLQDIVIHGARDVDPRGHVVGTRRRQQFVQEPQLFLGVRQRQFAVPRRPGNGHLPLRPFGRVVQTHREQPFGQCRHGRVSEEQRGGNLGAQRRLQSTTQVHRRQRIHPQRDEFGIGVDLVDGHVQGVGELGDDDVGDAGQPLLGRFVEQPVGGSRHDRRSLGGF